MGWLIVRYGKSFIFVTFCVLPTLRKMIFCIKMGLLVLLFLIYVKSALKWSLSRTRRSWARLVWFYSQIQSHNLLLKKNQCFFSFLFIREFLLICINLLKDVLINLFDFLIENFEIYLVLQSFIHVLSNRADRRLQIFT